MAFDWGSLAQGLGSGIGALLGLGSTWLTNKSNEGIANQNLMYQFNRDLINDARYADETAYNREFAEDERAYNRGFMENERDYQRNLQQEIFNREDTALERQASSLSSLGINPLYQQMNGLNAGQVLTPSTPGTATAPGMSTQSGKGLHNDMKYENLLNGITPIMTMMDTINGLKTGEYQRDILKAQRDRELLDQQEKMMDNLIKAKKYGIELDEDGNLSIKPFTHYVQDFEDVDYKDKNASAERNERENIFQKEYGTHDNSPKEEQVLTAFENQMENNNPIGRAVDPVLKSYNAFKYPLSDSLLMLLGIGASKINSFRESRKNSDKKPFWKNWFQSSEEMEKNYRR